MYEQWIRNQRYEVHRYYLPRKIVNRLKFIQKYFRVMNRAAIPQQYKLRKNEVEYFETAVIIFARLLTMCENDIPFLAGSGFLSPKPWASFGEVPEKVSKLEFRDFYDIANYYRPLIANSNATPEYVHFRIVPNLLMELGDKYRMSPHHLGAIAICLLYDILLNCGPDCEDFYDLFTNDNRDNSAEFIDINDWENLRCAVIGKNGRIRDRRWKVKLGQFYTPAIPLKSKLTFEEVLNSDSLEEGERVIIFKRKPEIKDVCFTSERDDDIEAPETDIAYQSRVSRTMAKYNGLLNPNPSWCL